MRVSIAVVVFTVVSVITTSALADVTIQDVEEARRRLRQVAAELEDEVAAYDAAVAEQVRLEERLERLILDLSARERELTLARRQARERAAAMYMAAGAGRSGALVGIDDFGAFPTRFVYLESVTQTDTDVVNRLEVARREFEQLNALVDEAIVHQESVITRQEEAVAVIYGRLEEANAQYQAVKTEWDRQEEERRLREWLATSTTTTTTTTTQPQSATTTTAAGGTTVTTAPPPTPPPPPPSPPGTLVCPVDGATTFRDSWGEPRSGGRGHTGVDMMAAPGTPLVAIEGGTIYSPGWHYAGGLGLYILGGSGDTWYYAHLSAYVDGLSGGMRVEAGQRVGYVGSTGNAAVPHLHLGWQPGGGAYSNPYPVVAEIC